MALRLTTPFARGADRLELTVRGQAVDPYDFHVHRALFGDTPRPLYVLQARADVPADTVVVCTVADGPSVRLPLPEGLPAGTTAALPAPAGFLTGIATSTLTGPQEQWWRLTALLGTLSRLLWVAGWERDHLRRQLARTAAQRSVGQATRAALGLHGAGLGLTRSPGEDDTAYRRRVALARRWTLPTPAGFTAALNAAVGPVGGFDDPLVADDANAELRRGLLALRVVPVTLLPGRSIDAEGRTGGTPLPLAEGYFDPYFLVPVDTALTEVGPPPPGPVPAGTDPPDPGRVQPPVAGALRRLAGLLTGRALVTSGFDPTAPDARATGRAVLLAHPTASPGRLAALAHRAGFDLVTHRPDGLVYAECSPGELLSVDTGAGAVAEGGQLTVSMSPAPPSGASVRWWVVRCGAGGGAFAGAAEGTSVTFTGTAAGRVIVTAELRFGPHTLTASREIVVLPAPLSDGQAIGADGTRNPPPPAPGTPLDPVFLVRHDDPRVEYGTDPNHHLMRREVAGRLDALLVLLAGTAGKPVVQAAYTPGGTGLPLAGRELRLTHPSVAAGPLAVLAHRAGFDYVRVDGGAVTASQAEGEPVGVLAEGLADGILEVGATAKLTVSPAESAVGTLGVLSWSTGDGAASLLTTAPGEMSVRGERPGPAWVQASYRLGDRPGVYQVALRLRPELSGHVLTPAQRELITGLLGSLHPLGVEAVTRELTGGSP
ncbi:hypothetical protein BU197_07160 [Streptomyces sp. CBMA291]|nr:hypothetical protein [Streptomyces sp. CBMA291]MBD0714505.1 hypothetical protein [Streptomyces sp. CBMA370]